MLAELQAIKDYRHEHDLSFAQLAAQMRSRDAFVSAAALFKITEADTHDQRRPYSRTLYKIRKFLKAVKDDADAAKRAARRRRPRVAAGRS